MADDATNLEELLAQIEEAANGKDSVTVDAVMQAVGDRSFGPLLLTAGLILASPLSGIPGLSTTMAVFVLIVAGQLLMQRKHFWLPGWILKRSITSSRLQRAMKALKKAARLIDKPLRPRLQRLTHAGGSRVVASACILIGVVIPPLELIPFVSSIAGVALAIFGLSLIAHDGLLALIAYVLASIIIVWLISALL